jgi:large subunit ribosomal protein L17
MTIPKLGRKADHRNRTVRNLLTSLVLHESITTTRAKAISVRAKAERLMTHIRRQDLPARRYAKALLFDDNAVTKLFEDVPSRIGTRTSGFIRLTKMAPRPGDGSEMMRVELLLTPIEEIIAAETKTKTRVRKVAAPAEASAETETTETAA